MSSATRAAALCALCLGAALPPLAEGGRAKISPVESVVNLIKKLQAKTTQEGKEEAAAYDKFACFCKEQADDKLYSIEKKTAKMALLDATIKSAEAAIVELNREIRKQNKEIDDITKKCEDEQKTRDDQYADYVTLRDDIAGAIAGAQEGIDMLSSKKAPGQFIQLETGVQTKLQGVFLRLSKASAKLPVSKASGAAYDALLQLSEGADAEQDPHASEFHSDKIIEMMKDFMKKFKSQKNEVDEMESNEKHEFDMAQAARKNQIAGLEASVSEDEGTLGEKEDEKNTADEDLTKTTADKNADDAFLADLTTQCEEKATTWDQRSKTRSGELTALSKALAVLEGEVVGNYGANSKLTGLVEVSTAAGEDAGAMVARKQTLEEKDAHIQEVLEEAAEEGDDISLLQKGKGQKRHSRGSDRAQAKKVLAYLKQQQATLKSDNLGALMMQMKEDHFVKVRTMIKDMIAKLEADAAAEADQKAWCDEAMTRAMEQRDENTGAIEGDTATVTKSEATIMKLQEEITKLLQEIADLKKGLSEATTLRANEQAENAKTITDATAGNAGVTQAIKILKEFYEGAFVQYTPPNAGADGQTVSDMAPDSGFEGEYHGNQDAASGILGMLDVIKSDFERTIETTNDEEDDASTEFDKYKADTESDISEKEGLIKTKKGEQKETKGVLADSKEDLSEHTQLKEESLAELAKLKPSCVSTGSDYAETVARREQEIESLKNAYMILDEMR